MAPEKIPPVADYHVHTPYCGHAQGKMVDYVKCAIDAGLPEIGFSDHLGRYYLTKSQKRRYWDWGMDQRNLGRYLSEIAIRSGLEIDYIEGAEDLLRSILSLYSLDYLLGSIHCLPSQGWKHLAHYARKDPWPVYEQYFAMAQAAIASGIFDSLAHIDFIWRYVKWPDTKAEQVFANIDHTIKMAADRNVAIEINSNGFLWSQLYKVNGGDPFEALLTSLKKHGADITIGSDAHKPEFVGKAYGGLIPALKRQGIKRYTTIEQRKRRSVALP